MSLTIAEILTGTGVGATQSVGQMQVIPILGDDDDTFAPPEVEIGTRGYGTVSLRNDSDRPTIVPPGAGWVVAQKAQDHAVGGGVLLKPGAGRDVDTAMCIQQSQGGYIDKAKHAMLILPVALRARALSVRHVVDFRKLWEGIGEFNKTFGLTTSGGHLEAFLKAFQKELDTFVAEFEIVPRQVGAIILVAGKVAGIERAPSAAFWRALWEPLVRVSYGSLALQAARRVKTPPATRAALSVTEKSLTGLRDALRLARAEEQGAIALRLAEAREVKLDASGCDDALGDIELKTVAHPMLSGQVATVNKAVRYASLCAAA